MAKNKQYKYYDGKEFDRILDLKFEKSNRETLKAYYDYINKYPYDTTALVSFASFLIDIGEIEDAEKILDDVTITKNTTEKAKQFFVFTRIKLLGFQNKFQECYDMVQENIELLYFLREDFHSIIVYLQKKLNLPIEDKFKNYSYSIEQILDYSEEKALEHISVHEQSDSKQKSKFLPSFPIEEYYHYFRKILPLDDYKKRAAGIFRNTYIFKYDNCGVFNGKILNYIIVVTMQDSNDIITMYPFDNKIEAPYIDITPVIEDTSYQKIKRMSQIDKFNKRYGTKY